MCEAPRCWGTEEGWRGARRGGLRPTTERAVGKGRIPTGSRSKTLAPTFPASEARPVAGGRRSDSKVAETEGGAEPGRHRGPRGREVGTGVRAADGGRGADGSVRRGAGPSKKHPRPTEKAGRLLVWGWMGRKRGGGSRWVFTRGKMMNPFH